MMIYKGVTLDDVMIDSYVDKLECSIAEACDAILCDRGLARSDEQENLTKKAQFAGVGKIVKADHKQHKIPTKKADNEKKLIISALFEAIDAFSDGAAVRNDEKYIDFVLNGSNYTLNLVKHRKEK